MANFVATTACNGPRLKDSESAENVLKRYIWDGEMEVAIRTDEADKHAYLVVYGYDWPGAWKIPEGVAAEDFEPDDDVDSYGGFEAFLMEIAAHLAEPLTIQSVGSENCRFPLSAVEWHVQPGGTEIEINGFERG